MEMKKIKTSEVKPISKSPIVTLPQAAKIREIPLTALRLLVKTGEIKSLSIGTRR